MRKFEISNPHKKMKQIYYHKDKGNNEAPFKKKQKKKNIIKKFYPFSHYLLDLISSSCIT